MNTADATAPLAPAAGYALDISLKGETPQELWSSLLELVCYACECKQKQDNLWPHMVSTDAGKIVVTQNGKLCHRWGGWRSIN